MLTFEFDNSEKKPLYEQLYIHIKKEIESGIIKSGEKLPSKRSLAAHLKISVVTVETAYSQLAAEGYIYSKPGSGFYAEKVSEKISPETGQKPVIPAAAKEREYKYDFRTNRVDTDLFPFSAWAKLSREILSAGGDELLCSCDSKGVYRLREAIASYLRSFRGMEVHPEQIVVGAGSEYLTGLIIQLLGRDIVYGVENPGYVKTHRVFQANCSQIVPVPVDRSGADTAALEASGAGAVHITPSHHFPIGTVMPVSRRYEILNWAYAAPDRYIIEDDYDSDFRFSGRPVPALQSMDYQGRVIYINTFTKSLAPSMRIGYMVLPVQLLERFSKRLGFYACTVPVFEQLTLCEFITRGYFDRHISRMKKLYRTRRDRFLECVGNCRLSESTEIIGSAAGLHVLLHSLNGMSEKQMTDTAAECDVRVYGLSEYYSFGEKNIPEGIVVAGYSGMNCQQIEAGVNALEKAWI
ncbi:MAG: PLP-dependent aminotransferase family protein [Porcipelethomonas sp.]